MPKFSIEGLRFYKRLLILIPPSSTVKKCLCKLVDSMGFEPKLSGAALRALILGITTKELQPVHYPLPD